MNAVWFFTQVYSSFSKNTAMQALMHHWWDSIIDRHFVSECLLIYLPSQRTPHSICCGLQKATYKSMQDIFFKRNVKSAVFFHVDQVQLCRSRHEKITGQFSSIQRKLLLWVGPPQKCYLVFRNIHGKFLLVRLVCVHNAKCHVPHFLTYWLIEFPWDY